MVLFSSCCATRKFDANPIIGALRSRIGRNDCNICGCSRGSISRKRFSKLHPMRHHRERCGFLIKPEANGCHVETSALVVPIFAVKVTTLLGTAPDAWQEIKLESILLMFSLFQKVFMRVMRLLQFLLAKSYFLHANVLLKVHNSSNSRSRASAASSATPIMLALWPNAETLSGAAKPMA